MTGKTSWNEYFGLSDDDFSNVNISSSEKLSTVYTCLKVRSESFAQLPVGVFREKSDKKESVKNNVYELIHNSPNSFMTAFDFWYALGLFRDTWGNGVAEIIRDGFGAAIELIPLEPWETQIVEQDGRMWFVYKGRPIAQENALHLKNHSKGGKVGVSTLTENRVTLGLALKQEKYAGKVYGSKPPGFLSYEGVMGEEQKKANRESWQKQVDSGTPILSGGFKYTPIILPPGDAQYIESRTFSKGDILGIFRVPPIFIQDYERATFSNAEQSELIFVKHTIMPLVIQAEQECNRKLFGPINKKKSNPLYVKFNLNGLLRGDMAAREKFYSSMLGKAVFSPNDVLKFEDMDGYEGGDRKYIQAGFIPVDKVDEFISSKSMTPNNAPAEEKPMTNLLKSLALNGHNGHGH